MQQTENGSKPGASRVANLFVLACFASVAPATWTSEAIANDIVQRAEARRIEMIDRISPAVVCVLDTGLRAGGSGVLISPEGFGLTNYHVVAGLLDSRTGWGGLGNGERYLMEVLGVDITGDVAMFRLFAPSEDFAFPFVPLGDSDEVRIGDTAIAMGNPFNLSEDFTPSVTLGLVTGVERYQWGVRGNLTYTNCIQADTPINPGNSGGPLFNAAGEVIGINGRISINERGRYNVGLGYAISANQIKRFLPSLRAGLLTRHGTWHARVESLRGEGMVVVEILKSGPAAKAGLQVGDKLLSLDGIGIRTVNQVISLLGTYPAHWPILVGIERDGDPRNVVVRLDPIEPRMRRPYKAPELVNRREVKRVLRGFQRTVLGDSKTPPPSAWDWIVSRGEGSVDASDRYLHFISPNGKARMYSAYADGTQGDRIEYDARSAVGTISDTTETYDLDPEKTMILGALYVLHTDLLGLLDNRHPTEARYVGGDGFVPTVTAMQAEIPRSVDGRATPRILEVIEWPLTEETSARYAFNQETNELVRIVLRDKISDAEVTMYVSDYRDIGGIRWPTKMEVIGDGYHYIDRSTYMEISP